MRTLLSPVMRMRAFYAGLLVTILLPIVAASPATAATTQAATLPAAVCIPSNNIFAGPLGPLMNSLTGALGGLLWPLTILVVVLLAVGALVFVLTNKSALYMKAIGAAVGILLGVPILIALISGLWTLANNLC